MTQRPSPPRAGWAHGRAVCRDHPLLPSSQQPALLIRPPQASGTAGLPIRNKAGRRALSRSSDWLACNGLADSGRGSGSGPRFISNLGQQSSTTPSHIAHRPSSSLPRQVHPCVQRWPADERQLRSIMADACVRSLVLFPAPRLAPPIDAPYILEAPRAPPSHPLAPRAPYPYPYHTMHRARQPFGPGIPGAHPPDSPRYRRLLTT